MLLWLPEIQLWDQRQVESKTRWVIPSPWIGGESESLAGPRAGLAQALFRIHTWLRHARHQGSTESLTSDIHPTYIPWDSPDIQSCHLQNKYWLSSGKGISISLRNAEDRDWKGNLKLFSESRGSDNGRTGSGHGQVAGRAAGPCTNFSVSFVLIFPFLFLLCCSFPVLAAFAAF